jgi:hypothetical protein
MSLSPQHATAPRLELNIARWPVIEVTNPIAFTDDEWLSLLAQIAVVIKRDQPFAMINDVRIGPPPSAHQRKAITKLYRLHMDLVKKNWRGTALITNSALVLGAITALNWLMPPPHPSKVCSNYADGEKWAFQQLGLPVAHR